LTQYIKDKIRERYGKMALTGNSDSCCMPEECCGPTTSLDQALVSIGYRKNELDTIPDSSKLGVGCGAPLNYADLKEGETVVDLGSGAGIDVFLAAKQVNNSGKVIGIDFTDDMLHIARKAAKEHGFRNVEFKKGDIESKIPVEEGSIDVIVSNCVINLTTDKVKAFKEVYRILKKEGKGRMVIADLVTSKEVRSDSVNAEDWCSCIDGALTKENYIYSIQKAGFHDIKVIREQPYLGEDNADGRKITSIIVRAVT
jgi:arsenite methyltransferase